jgi:peptide deformylase
MLICKVDLIQALNENGDEITLTGTGDLAKCFCHEIDHLEGILKFDNGVEGASILLSHSEICLPNNIIT